MVYKRQLDFKHGCPSGYDTSKLLSDDLKNELYYDGFQKMLYHYSHQENREYIALSVFFFAHKRCKKAAAVQKRPLLQTVNPAVKILKFCGIHAKI